MCGWQKLAEASGRRLSSEQPTQILDELFIECWIKITTSALKTLFRNKISGLEIEQNLSRNKVQIPWPEFGLIFTNALSWNSPVACTIKLYGFPFYGKEEKLRRKFKGSSIKHFSLN